MENLKKIIDNRKSEKIKILIICASNVCRSPYGEYTLKRLIEKSPVLKNIVEVKSGGVINRSKKIFDKTRVLMLSEGWTEDQIAGHVPAFKRNFPERFDDADIIIGMSKIQKLFCPHRSKFITLSQAADDNYRRIRDPWLEKNQENFNQIMYQIRDFMPMLINKLEDLVQEK